MAITNAGLSAKAEGASGDLTVTNPTTQADDILIAFVTTFDNVVSTFPAGWTKFNELNQGTASRSTMAWKRCTGNEGTTLITHTAGDSIVAATQVYRGCVASGSPINASSSRAHAAATALIGTSITPTVDGCMCILSSHSRNDITHSAWSATNPAVLNEQFDYATVLGTDATVAAAEGLQTTASATGAGAITGSGSEQGIVCWTALEPAASSGTSAALSGSAATASAGALVPSSAVAISGSAAAALAGSIQASRTIALSGLAVTASAGTVGLSRSVSLSGAAVAASSGSLTASISTPLVGGLVNVSAGVLSIPVGSDLTLALTGQAITVSAGSLSPAASVGVSGSSASALAGSLAATASRALSGQSLAASQGSLATARTIALNASAVSVSAGTLTYAPQGDVTVALSGIAVAGSAGTLRVLPADDLVGGYYFYEWPSRRKRKRREEQIEEEIEQLAPLEREIAQLLHEQQSRDDRRAELERLDALIARSKKLALNKPAQRALKQYQVKPTLAKLARVDEALIGQIEEEEEYLVLQLLLDD